ncbi:5-hydroxytryptamine receptor 5B-like [Tubulanus polymorphus]|uniref:5-hydroxytryptamine receptor 5B-like n=1 Tax=Tubulanus polymorphus TaxID=672921 RepID=UPI003DA695EC
MVIPPSFVNVSLIGQGKISHDKTILMMENSTQEFESLFVYGDAAATGAAAANSSSALNVTPVVCHDCSAACGVSTKEIIIGFVLAFFIFLTIFGNVLVLVATIRVRHMWTVSNGMIASLATADLLVAIAVLPLSLQQEVCNQVWTLGTTMCVIWMSADVFCCTASILNIASIALDRYFSIVMNVEYTHRPDACFSRRRVCIAMITMVWTISLLIAVSPPLFNWYAGNEFDDPYSCIISHDLGYTIFSTFGAFYIPLAIILFVYYKIYRVVLARAAGKRQVRPVYHTSSNDRSVITEVSELNTCIDRAVTTTADENGSTAPLTSKNGFRAKRRTRDQTGSTSSSTRSDHKERSRRSVKLLGIIIACFTLCWLPFFIPVAILPFCPTCRMPPKLYSFVLWLGYSNSFLNPFIYALWSQDFQNALRKLLPCLAGRVPRT